MTLRRVSITVFAAVVLLSACATKPPSAPEPEPGIVAPVEKEPELVAGPAPETAAKEPEITREELDALLSRVVALRKDAFDLGLKDVLATEYADAESQYLTGKGSFDADDRPTAKAELGKAEILFGELVAKGVLVVAGNKKAAATAARDRAMKADAESLSQATLATADSMYAEGETAMTAGDSRAAIAAYSRAAMAFDAVEKRSAALSVKAKVDELEYGAIDAGNYELAGKSLDSVDGQLATDIAAAQDAAAEALLRYRLVLAKGWELRADGKRTDAERMKAESDKIKASVAVKEQYAEAKAVWDSAGAALAAGDSEAAVQLFEQAEAKFKVVYDLAAAKRAAAEAAILAASAKNEESAGIAKEGDQTLGAAPVPAADGTKE